MLSHPRVTFSCDKMYRDVTKEYQHKSKSDSFILFGAF